MRITGYYIWSFVFVVFFLLLLVMALIILDSEARLSYTELTFIDLLLLTLATWRLNRLIMCDHITAFIREQFYDIKRVGKKISLEQPKRGPFRVMVDLVSCTWCTSLWSAFILTFFFLLFEWFYFVILFMAFSAASSGLNIVMQRRHD